MKRIAYVRATNIYDDSRATKEILSLAKDGYYITVFGWGRDRQAAARCETVFDNVKSQVQCLFFDKPLANGIGLKNIDKLIAWVNWVYSSLRSNGPFDAVHACNLDAGLGAKRYCKKHHIPLVYDIYDYYIDSHAIPSFLVGAVEKAEIGIINFAETTIICTEERREQIAKATPKNVIVLHNSPDVERPQTAEIRYDYAYCGSLGPKRLLGEMLNEYENNTDLVFGFAGYGNHLEQAASHAESYANFSFLGSLPYAAVLETENQAKVLSAIYEPTIRNHRLCAPNKFYESLALAKPIIVCRGTGIDRIVEQYDLGIVIEYDAEQFFAAVRALISDPERCAGMGHRARQLYEQEYRWNIMSERMLVMYRQLLK